MKEQEDKLKEVKKKVRIFRLVMSGVGIWPYENPTIYYRLLACLVAFLLLQTFCGCINFIVANSDNLMIMLNGMGLSLSISCVMLKGGSLIYFRKDNIRMNKKLEELIDKQMKGPEDVCNVMLEPMVVFARKIFYLIYCLGFGMVLVQWLRPTVAMTKQYMHGYNITYRRPFPSVYPWKIEPGSDLWKFHFFVDSITTWFYFSIGISTDENFTHQAAQIIGQFSALNYEISNLKVEDVNNDKMKDFVERHQDLMDLCQTLGDCNGLIVLVLTLSAAIILCTLSFQCSKMETITVGELTWLLTYIFYKLLQIFLFAWSGEIIKKKSEELRDNVYGIAWTDKADPKVNHAVRFMMHQRPVVLQALGIKPISAELFSGVVNTSMSYFFLLRTISE
uniref:Odorant receptor n=1 Tax=Aphidius gifuensis TaxID=684658 RepID=A0A3Q9EJT0_APHGI|nr:odorant receptor [Aphidius gifuensis]